MFSPRNIICILAYYFLSHLGWGQTQYPPTNYDVDESYPDNLESLTISLPTNTDTGIAISSYDVNESNPLERPTYGSLSGVGTQTLIYTPNLYNESTDQFIWKALIPGGTLIKYKIIIDINSVNNPPEFGVLPSPTNLKENQNTDSRLQFTVVDYDSDASQGELTLTVQEDPSYPNDDDWFTTSFESKNQNTYTFNVRIKNSLTFNYEAPPFAQTQFTFGLNLTDDGGSSVVETITVDLEEVNEAPVILSYPPPPNVMFTGTLNEGEDTETKQDFQPIQINASDPEGLNLNWKYTLSDNNIGGTVKLNGTELTAGQLSAVPFASSTNLTVDYDPDPDDYGTQVLTFSAYDGTYYSGNVQVSFTINRVDDDPISLNEPSSSIDITWQENQTGTLHDFDPSDPDSTANDNTRIDNNASSTEGAKIYYSITGNDAEFFEISSDGQLTFKSTPDFENPVDETGYPVSNELEGDNVYNIDVTVRDTSDPNSGSVTTDTVAVNVTVTNVNELPTLDSGIYFRDIYVTEDTNWTWSNSAFPLIASDVDAGHDQNLIWRMKFNSDGNFGTASVSGTGKSPDSLSYSPNFDYDGSDGKDSFTVEIFDGVGVTELDFNVTFSPVSDAPRLDYISPSPIESISLDLDTYTINLEENNPATVRIDYLEVDGDPIKSIEFEGGDQILDNEDFDLDFNLTQQFVEISFKSSALPDFEAPADDNGDGIYSVKITAKDIDGLPITTQLNFVITNVDDSPTFSNSINFSPQVMENQTFVSNLSGNDQEGVTSFRWSISPNRDYDKFVLDINSSTLSPTNVLRFKAAPDYENPLDGSEQGDLNNTYSVEVRISDSLVGGYSSSQVFSIVVDDDNDEPVFKLTTPTSIQINETELTVADMNLSKYVEDEDNFGGAGPDDLIWQKLGGETQAFSLAQDTGILSFTNLSFSDYEYQAEYDISVRVLDQRGGYADRNFTIQLQDINEPPQFFENNESNTEITFLRFDLDEDTSFDGNLSDYVRDPEASIGAVDITYSYNSSSVDYNGSLKVYPKSGRLTYTPNKDFHGLTSLTVDVTDDDDANPQTSSLKIEFHVEDVEDAPILFHDGKLLDEFDDSNDSINEHDTTWEYELNAIDQYDLNDSGNPVYKWSISGPDFDKFYPLSDGPNKKLKLYTAPDFENPKDADSDNTYSITVDIWNQQNYKRSYPFLFHIDDIDENAIFDYQDNASSVTSKDAGEYPEGDYTANPEVVFQAMARDIDLYPSSFLQPIEYGFTAHDPGQNDNNLTISGGGSLFSIDSDTGEISIIAPVDYEKGQGMISGDPNIYTLEVNASTPTSSNQASHLVYITVTNVVEPPSFDLNLDSNSTFAENEMWEREIIFLNEDTSVDRFLEISGGADMNFFQLERNVATGVTNLSFKSIPDYESPLDNDSDNKYEVEIRISGTSETRIFTHEVTPANDNPLIDSTDLTKIIINENTGFVVDLDVSDQDSDPFLYDLLYHTSSDDIRYFGHTGDGSNIFNSYTSGSTGWTDLPLNYDPSSILNGDFNRDGYEDLIIVSKSANELRHLQYDQPSSSFVEQTGDDLHSSTIKPGYATVIDLDQDGDLDVISTFVDNNPHSIKWFDYNKTGSNDFTVGNIYEPEISSSFEEILHFAVGDLDGDSYYDLAVARKTDSVSKVSILLGQSAAFSPTFKWNVDFTNDFGINDPRWIELADLDNNGSLDIIVAGQDNVTILYNGGMGTNEKLSVSKQTLATFDGVAYQVRAFDLNLDQRLDLIFTSFSTDHDPVRVFIQDSSGKFNETANAFPDLDPTSNPNRISFLPATTDTRPCIVLQGAVEGEIAIYEATASLDGTFENPHLLEGTGGGEDIESLLAVNLTRRSEIIEYEFSGGDDILLFDEDRFKDSGKLYFKNLPDHEDPKDEGRDNFYEVIAKVSDGNGSSSKKIKVFVSDVNDAPVITSFDGNWTASFDHNESNTSLYLFTVTAENNETIYGDEELTYSRVEKADYEHFHIDPETGEVFLLSQMDNENPQDENEDNNYTLIVRVTDDGIPSAYDEQNISIIILDGWDPPTFGNNITSFVIDEDTSLINVDLNLSDDSANPAPGPGVREFKFIGLENGDADVDSSYIFSYTPDANYTGVESFTIVAINYQDLNATLDINITVTSIPDVPEITTPRIIDVDEQTQLVQKLKANDDSSGGLSWSWVNDGSPDPDFDLSSSGTVKFRNHDGIDYENSNNQVEEFLPTDAVGLVLWLDADDNETLFKSNSFVDNVDTSNIGTSVGGWLGKSSFENNVSGSVSINLPKIGSINGKTALDFEGDQRLSEVTRLGLPADPDLMIFAVTQIDENNSGVDTVLKIGSDVGGSNYIMSAAGSEGWSWRFNSSNQEAVTFTNAPSTTTQAGIQVWERPALLPDENFADPTKSKFYLNGKSYIGESSGSSSPSSTHSDIQIGDNFDGRIGELIVLNSTAVDDRQKLEGYLAHKWGLTAKLPTDHPYRYISPRHIQWHRTIRVTDSDGNYTDSNFTFRVNNQNDNPPVINNPELQSDFLLHFESSELNPSNYFVIDLNVSDVDGDIVEFSVVGGKDEIMFDFNNSSKLSFVSSDKFFPDYELPGDSDGDNVYEVEIQITDGNPLHSINKLLKIEILNGNETAPEFTYNDQTVTSLELNRTENNSTVIQLTTKDDWTGPIRYEIVGGTEGSYFDVNETTGVLSFILNPNYEDPYATDNEYQVLVSAIDEGNYSTQLTITVNVNDVNEPPGLGVNLPIIVDEDSSETFLMEIYDPEDKDKAIYPFELKVPPAHGEFTDAGQGQYTYTPDPDYNGNDMIVITVNDVTLQEDFNVTFQINPVADNPTAMDDDFVVEINKGEIIALDVLYNDSNLPDANNSQGLSILNDTLVQPNSGFIETDGSTIQYTPESGFIGPVTFSYTMQNDSNLSASASVSVIIRQADGLKDWRFMQNIGFYMLTPNNWIYHGDLGWMFVRELNNLSSVTWIWHEQIGWFWSGNRYLPDIYINDFSNWFTFSTPLESGKYLGWPIYNQDEQEWIDQNSFVEMQQNLVKGQIQQALDGLSNNDEIIEYIETLSFFTKEQIAIIKYELKFKGISKTLTTLLQE